MLLRSEGEWLDVLGMADERHPDVREMLQKIRNPGVRALVMLTGDHQGVGDAIGRRVAGIGPAVFVHEGSTLIVIANALRLLRYG